MRGWAKFNAWSKITPATSESLNIYFNSGRGKLKNNPWLVNGRNGDLSNGANNALKAFFQQIKPDYEFKADEFDIKEHEEALKDTSIGTFCITDIAKVGNKAVSSDGLWLVTKSNDIVKLYNCNNFATLEF